MGKTRRKFKWARTGREGEVYESTVEQPEKLTYEWALEKTSPRVEYWLAFMAENGTIQECDVEDYRSLVQRRLMRAVDLYDPERVGENGRRTSAYTYLKITVESTFANIVKAIDANGAVEVPISNLPPSELEGRDAVSEDDERLSDRCRGFEMLWLRMDLAVLVGMLTLREHVVLVRRLEGYSNQEIADELFTIRQTVERTILPNLRRKARVCGFVPHGERAVRRAEP